MITRWHRDISPWADMARRALRWKGLRFERVAGWTLRRARPRRDCRCRRLGEAALPEALRAAPTSLQSVAKGPQPQA